MNDTLTPLLERFCEVDPTHFQKMPAPAYMDSDWCVEWRTDDKKFYYLDPSKPINWETAGRMLEQMQKRFNTLDMKKGKSEDERREHFPLYQFLRLGKFILTPEAIFSAYLNWKEVVK